MGTFSTRHHIKWFSFFLLSSVSFASLVNAQNNNIVIDQNAHAGVGAPNFVQSSNGTDVLNIVKPTNGGVSHNKFLEYNVSDKNLILNNLAFQNGVPQGESTLGGTVAYNPNFGTGNSARVILNEVTSNSTTALNGYTEIFGQKAALIIANPNGITAAGAGFINLSRLTMITGKPNVINGKVQDFALSPVCTIKVEGVGEEAFGMHVQGSPAELVSNAVKIAGNIYLDADQQLSILSGNDKYDYENRKVTSKSQPSGNAENATESPIPLQVTVAIDASNLGAMRAGQIKIEATQSGLGIRTDGNLIADMDNIEITAEGDITFKNAAAKKAIEITSSNGNINHKESASAFAENNIKLSAKNDIALKGDFILSDSLEINAGKDIDSETQLAALTTANISAGNDINIKRQFVNANDLKLSAQNNVINDAKIVAEKDLNIKASANFITNGTVLAQNNGNIDVGNAIELNGVAVSAKNLNLTAQTITNNTNIGVEETLTITTSGDLTNNSKMASGADTNLSADNIHNLGQIAANGDININVKNDYINHRDSGLLGGMDVVIEAGHDIVNYLAEIFAGNNIELKGKDARIDDTNPDTIYDNPNIEDKHTSGSGGNGKQEIQSGENETAVGLEINLENGYTLSLPEDAFVETPSLGDSYRLDGYTIYIGERIVTPAKNPDDEPTVTFQNIDKLTILDADGNNVNYSLFDESEGIGEDIDTSGNTDEKTSPKLDDRLNDSPFIASVDQFNSLVNLGGRIESFNDINIRSDKIYNMGYNHNIGDKAYDVYYDKIRDQACWNCGVMELGRYKISNVYMDAEAGSILAGHDLNINSRDILNQSSTLSAKHNAIISAYLLSNQTYNEVANLAIYTQYARKYKKHMKAHHKIYNYTEYYQERIYSNEASLVTAGNNLVINAAGGTVVNDQVEEAVGSFRFGRDEAPDLKSGKVEVDLNAPRGDNGMFVVGDNPKYMITANVDFLNSNSFVGSDYFFDRVTPFSNEYSTRKMLGDPAYETRLIMDAIRESTYGHYLGNGEISNDLEQMKALYNNASKEYERLDLKIGIALTPEQISQLNKDIIWYVEKEVNGQKVLVPELYLSQATLDNIKIGGYGAKMIGGNVAINMDNLSNSGDIFAKNELLLKSENLLNESNRGHTARIIGGKTEIKTGNLTNRSGTIGGTVTSITADNVLNETKKYSEETSRKQNYNLIEKTGQQAVISGDMGLQIEAKGDYVSKGAKLESKQGDVALKAKNIVLDTVELHNREERTVKKSGFLSKKTTTTIKDSIKNVGSAIVSGGNAFIESVKDIFSKGSKVEAGKDAQVIAGGDVTLVAAEDSEYSYSKTKKSSWGGLKKSLDEVEHEEKRLKGSNLKTTDGLTVLSGKDTTIVASNVEAGKDANILAGYKVGADTKVEKSGEQGSVNIVSGEESSKHREKHEKTDMTKAFTSGFDIGLDRGKISISKDVGEETKDTWDNVQKNVVSSNVVAGGDLNIGATEDINIKGSNVYSGNNIDMIAGKNINITSAESTEDDQKTHSETNLKLNAGVGHVAVDAVYTADDLVKATEEVKKAKDSLDKMKQLHSQGKASAEAVRDAELNLAAATVNLTTATEAAAAAAAKAAASAPLLGFHADAGLTADTIETKTSESTVTNTASTVQADKDIKLNAGKDLNQVGSVVISEHGNIDYNVAENLNLQASKDTYRTDSKTSNSSVSVGASTNSGAYGDISAGKSNSKSHGTHYNNSATIAEEGKININVGKDMNADGYNALGKDVAINVGGDMNLNSKQDIDYSKNNSQNGGFGGGSSSQHVSIGNSSGESDRAWVDNQSSIIGTESVDIDVEGKLGMEGSLIANIDKDGKDAGNLDIKAGSIETKDIYNRDNNSETGFGFSTSTGSDPKGSNDGHPGGTTSVTVTDKGSEKEGITHSTIGQGNIEIADGSDISGINRDINKTETITKDEITGALDATVKIDNRVLGLVVGDTSGVNDIMNDIKNLPNNIQTVIKDISSMPEQVRDAAVNAYKEVVKEEKGFTPERVNEYSPEEITNMLKNGTLLQIEEEEEEEELKFDKNNPIIGVSGKTDRKYTVGNDGKVYDITDDYIEKNYVTEEVIAIVTGTKVVKYVYTGIQKALDFNDSLSQHTLQRMQERGITKNQIKNALEKPISKEPIRTDPQTGLQSQKIIGKDATVAINPSTGKIITVYKTGTKVLEKLGGIK